MRSGFQFYLDPTQIQLILKQLQIGRRAGYLPDGVPKRPTEAC